MDLNNEMILTRKHIKNAKVRVIRKLVRHISNLKRKKGAEKQLEQNKNRISKLGEEISTIQNLVPDKIFKYLLTSNLTLEELSKQANVDLQERACVRIGLVPFINQRMKEIKQRVDEFDKTRSNKDEITSLKVAEKLQSIRDNSLSKKTKETKAKKTKETKAKHEKTNNHKKLKDLKNSNLPNQHLAVQQEEKTKNYSSKTTTSAKSTSKNDVSIKKSALSSQEDSCLVSLEAKVLSAEENNSNISDEENYCFNEHPPIQTLAEEDRGTSSYDESDVGSNSDEQNMEENSGESSFFESDVDSNAEEKDIEVVLPDFYAQDKRKTKGIVSKKRKYDVIDEPEAETIPSLRNNAGEGFADSDEEEAAIRRRRWADFESDDDDFFITDSSSKIKCKNPVLNAQLKKLMDRNPTGSKNEQSSNPAVNRLQDMNPIASRKGKRATSEKTLRPGQSKFFSQFSDLRNRNGLRGWKKSEGDDFDDGQSFSKAYRQNQNKAFKLVNERKNTAADKLNKQQPPAGNLHPSWLASKKKKEQSKLMEFTGTRITFDDSD